jgi:hypothetical protein
MMPTSVNPHTELSRFAGRIRDYGLTTPSIFFLESIKYMSFIGSQTLVFFGPIITAFINSDPYYRMSELLEDRNNIEFLITELERLEVEEKK